MLILYENRSPEKENLIIFSLRPGGWGKWKFWEKIGMQGIPALKAYPRFNAARINEVDLYCHDMPVLMKICSPWFIGLDLT